MLEILEIEACPLGAFYEKIFPKGFDHFKIMVNILENHEAQFPTFSVFIGRKSIFHRYCIQNVNDGIQTQLYNIDHESVNYFSQLISVKVMKDLRKSQAQFLDKVRKSRLRENDDFLIKRHVTPTTCDYKQDLDAFLLEIGIK